MNTREHAAKLRALADDLDPPPALIRLPSGDMTINEAGRIVKSLHTNKGGAPHLQLKVWLHYDPPKVEWVVGASLTSSEDHSTLRQAVEDLKRKLTPEAPGTVANAIEVLDAATEPPAYHDAIGEDPAELMVAGVPDQF